MEMSIGNENGEPEKTPLFHCIDGRYLGLKICDNLCANWLWLLLLPREFQPFLQRWDGIFRPHAESCVICDKSRLFPAVSVAAVVASDDGTHLPPFQLVIELMTADSYLAHEQLKELVDAGQFFGFSSPSSSAGCCSSCFAFSSSGTGKNSLAHSITIEYAAAICT